MPTAEGIVGEFFDLKAESGADLLAMQVGDFYEFFGEDAETVGEELDLKVSTKSSGGESYPMAGVPVDDLEPYLRALIERGYRVAIADQQEAGSGHERELTRTVSPGTLLSPTDATARYLATVVGTGPYGIALADVTTGRFFVTTVDGDHTDLISELYRFDPVELLPGPAICDTTVATRLAEELDAAVTHHDEEAFAPGRATHRVTDHFGAGAIESVGLAPEDEGVVAAGAALDYVAETGAGVLASFTRLRRYRDREHVALDGTTQRNLELVETMTGDREGSVLATIDRTVTAAGRRQLGAWLTRPLCDRDRLDRRQGSVAALAEAALARERLRETLGDVHDVERLASRATHGSADPHDLAKIRETLKLLPEIESIVMETPALAESPVTSLLDRPDQNQIETLRAELNVALAADPPATIADGGVIAPGYDEDLDTVVEEYERHTEYVESLPDQLSDELGLTHVSVGRNTTDGYYVQVGRSEADEMPDRFREIKALKNSKRFVTEELEERERAIFRLEEERVERERELFTILRDRVAERAGTLQDVGEALATVDALASLATHAVDRGWTRPELGPLGSPINIQKGRHPVVETTTDFVPNDAELDDARRFLIVTGPNMSGKSTYMRQTALIVLLAQVGSFVPAEDATIGLVDGIYTRVGALDELAQGRSTFMVEMQELSNILHSATDDSLVILDEVGRGTATYDGISIAWAATEYLHNEVGAKTLFATHYHELTTLADHLDRVANVHIAAEERDGDVTFLRTVRPGPTDRSYGIHVAELAGVPDPVLDRSRTVLERLRDEKAIEAKGGDTVDSKQVVFDLEGGTLQKGDPSQQSAANGGTVADESAGSPGDTPIIDEFGPEAEDVLEELAETPLAELPPVEALTRLKGWQDQLDT